MDLNPHLAVSYMIWLAYEQKKCPLSYNKPRGDVDTESVTRTMKEKGFWINEFRSYQ